LLTLIEKIIRTNRLSKNWIS